MTEDNQLNEPSDEGKIWVCPICGKQSHTQSGWYPNDKYAGLQAGWDLSCMMNSVLVDENRLIFGESDLVVEILGNGQTQTG